MSYFRVVADQNWYVFNNYKVAKRWMESGKTVIATEYYL